MDEKQEGNGQEPHLAKLPPTFQWLLEHAKR